MAMQMRRLMKHVGVLTVAIAATATAAIQRLDYMYHRSYHGDKASQTMRRQTQNVRVLNSTVNASTVDSGSHPANANSSNDTTATPSLLFSPPPPIQVHCDPCVKRSQVRLKGIVHGTESVEFWWNVRAAALQAARDMGVQLELELYKDDEFDQGITMARDILVAASSGTWDALIVTILDDPVLEAVQVASTKVPVFALNSGYHVVTAAGQLPGVLAYVGMDEYKAGQAAGEELLIQWRKQQQEQLSQVGISVSSSNNNTTTINPTITRALFINDLKGSFGLDMRQRGFNDTIYNEMGVYVEELVVNELDDFELATHIDHAFASCPYDIVLLGSGSILEVALRAMESNNCQESLLQKNDNGDEVDRRSMLLGSFDEDARTFQAIADGTLAFTISQQQYLQGVVPVLMASLYVTTNMKTSLPNYSTVYNTGPVLITRHNLPSDSLQICAANAFPVCPNQLTPDGTDVSRCDCFDRRTLRIGGVLQGVRTGKFWDIIFAAAQIAADDMGVQLDLERFEPQESKQVLHVKMAAKIKSLCESGVHGLFVSIPSDVVMQAVRDECLPLQIPVISVNSGATASAEELRLPHHIGMFEHSAGHAAAKELVRNGMKVGFCVNHNKGNANLHERCQGFEDALMVEEGDHIRFGGIIHVPEDNLAQSKIAIANAIAESDDNVDWTEAGLLLLGEQILPTALEVQDEHPGMLIGTFDVNADINEALASRKLLFAINQQPYLQGALPVYLLAYGANTNQMLLNHALQTGPSFEEAPPSAQEQVCKANFFQVCTTRPTQDYNFISDHWIITGWVFFAIMLLESIVCLAWIYFGRNTSPIVKSSQPTFLTLIVVGGLVSSFAIVTMGVQTGYRFIIQDGVAVEENPDIHATDAACMATWWLFGIGFALCFSALFAKIRRVKMIMDAAKHFRRAKIKIQDVSPILIGMLGAETTILLTWQLVSPEKWQRRVVREDAEGFTLASVGKCASDKGDYFKSAVVAFHILCLCYALVLCFQTKHLPSDYAETSYITLAVIGMFQILVLAVPIYVMVDEDTDIYYFTRGCVVFLQNFSVVSLIFVPKMLRSGQPTSGLVQGPSQRTVGSRQISGLASRPSSNPASRPNSEGDAFHDELTCTTEHHKLISCETCGGVLTCKFCESLKRLKEAQVNQKRPSNISLKKSHSCLAVPDNSFELPPLDEGPNSEPFSQSHDEAFPVDLEKTSDEDSKDTESLIK